VNITGVKVSFSRTRQAAQFEPAKAEVELSASIGETDAEANPNVVDQVAAILLAKATAAVYASLGLKVAPRAAPEIAEPSPTAAEGAAPVVPLAKRGRPPKKDPAATTAPTPAAPAATALSPTTSPAPTTGSAPADEETFDIDVEPAKPAAPVEATKPVTDNELQSAASTAAKRLGGADKVTKLMAEWGTARLAELKQEKRRAFIDALGKLE
jgi:hypothetical protein